MQNLNSKAGNPECGQMGKVNAKYCGMGTGHIQAEGEVEGHEEDLEEGSSNEAEATLPFLIAS